MIRRGLWAVVFFATVPALAEPPNREDFLREFLKALPSEDTSRFGQDGSPVFLPAKLGLLRDLPPLARSRDLELRTLLVVGPNGPRESYTVLVVFARRGRLIMNGINLEGPRILKKGSSEIAPEALGRFVQELTQSPLLREGGSTADQLESKLEAGDLPPERRFDLLLALWSEQSGPVFFFSDLRAESRTEVRALLGRMSVRFRALEATYVAGPAAGGDPAR